MTINISIYKQYIHIMYYDLYSNIASASQGGELFSDWSHINYMISTNEIQDKTRHLSMSHDCFMSQYMFICNMHAYIVRQVECAYHIESWQTKLLLILLSSWYICDINSSDPGTL